LNRSGFNSHRSTLRAQQDAMIGCEGPSQRSEGRPGVARQLHHTSSEIDVDSELGAKLYPAALEPPRAAPSNKASALCPANQIRRAAGPLMMHVAVLDIYCEPRLRTQRY